MSTYRFANAEHTLVIRNNRTLMFWHPTANTPMNEHDAYYWTIDGSQQPADFVGNEQTEAVLQRSGVKTE